MDGEVVRAQPVKSSLSSTEVISGTHEPDGEFSNECNCDIRDPVDSVVSELRQIFICSKNGNAMVNGGEKDKTTNLVQHCV